MAHPIKLNPGGPNGEKMGVDHVITVLRVVGAYERASNSRKAGRSVRDGGGEEDLKRYIGYFGDRGRGEAVIY